MDIFQYIQHAKISSLVMQFSICKDCHVVDSFMDRIIVGTPCPTCHSPSRGSWSYFNFPITGLVDLIQEAYGALPLSSGESSFPENPEMTHSISIIVFYSTLREALLARLVEELMIIQNLSIELRERLYNDYNTHNERLFKLFPALSGITWDKSIQLVQIKTGRDYTSVSDTMKEISDIRNRFIHEVNFSGISFKNASKCIEYLYPTFELFVALHNLLIHDKKYPKNVTAA